MSSFTNQTVEVSAVSLRRPHDECDNQEEYDCRNKGCTTPGRRFEAAPAEWFTGKGLNPPANCPSCREWKRTQEELGDLQVLCKLCQRTFKSSAESRIRYHKREGNWDSDLHMVKCTRCSMNPRIARYLCDRVSAGFYELSRYDLVIPDSLEETVRRRGFNQGVESIAVSDDPAFYATIPFRGREAALQGKSELDHLMKSGHKWFERFETDDPDFVLTAAAQLAASTDTEVMQCRSGSEKIKADIRSGLVVILTQYDMPNGGWRLRTAYVSNDVETHLRGKMNEKASNRRWHH